jgi:uncharacterized alpha-E superfamily protein
MLARDAENIYWMARYLERAENTSRLILKITDALLDIPGDTTIGWHTILQILGMDELYYEHHKVAKENDIMHFLIADERNPSSILACIKYARENTRTLREQLPEELWERVNSLYLYISSNIEDTAKKRRKKYIFLQDIIYQRQAIVGLIFGAMERNLPYYFMKMGRNLERADMTTRFMDVNYAITLPEDHPLYEVAKETLWVSVLKSLSAYQSYRHLQNFYVSMPDVVDFFFNEARFPRSIVHCLAEIEDCLVEIPNSQDVIKRVRLASKNLSKKNEKEMDVEKLHKHIDLAQQYLGDIHNALNDHYFDMFDQEQEQKQN